MKYLDHKLFISAALKKDLDSTKSRYNEASDKLLEKSRQLQKLQVCIKISKDDSHTHLTLMFELIFLPFVCRECMRH